MTVPVPILLYHSISGRASQRFRPWTLDPGLFEEHMELLVERGFAAVTLSHLIAAVWVDRQELPPNPVVLTFDDGFADFHSQALPVLERHRFGSTLFVTTCYVGSTAAWLAREGEGDRPMMGWRDLHDAAGHGVEIGAHTHTHPRLDELPLHRARGEILRSRDVLQDVLNRPVSVFAYPHGYYGPKVRGLVADAGFDGAVAVRHAMSSTRDDRFALARIIVYAGTSAQELDLLLRGHGIPQAPLAEHWRTTAWRVARQTRRALATTTRGGAGA